MEKRSFGTDDLAASLVNIGDFLEGIATATGLNIDPPEKYRLKIEQMRLEADYDMPYLAETPLITIRVSTYNGYADLVSRCLPSILAQTYTNWEVVIVGDSDPQAELIRNYLQTLDDSRFRFIQREYRGPYPENPRQAWLITGAHAFNVATREANGLWLAKLDQDDSWERNHLEVLLKAAKEQKCEVVYAKVRVHFDDVTGRPPSIIGEFPPKRGTFALTAALCHGKFKVFEMNEQSYLWNDPGDWGLSWRLWLGGARFHFVENTVANIYVKRKENLGYYESQYRILLATISSMQKTPAKYRKIIGYQGRIVSAIFRVKSYLKRLFS